MLDRFRVIIFFCYSFKKIWVEHDMFLIGIQLLYKHRQLYRKVQIVTERDFIK